MNQYTNFITQLKTNIPTLSIRIDRKDLINQLRGLKDPTIELWVNPNNLKVLQLKDSDHIYAVKTKQ